MLHLITGPAVEPLSISEIKSHLRWSSSDVEPVPSAPTAALASPAAPGNVDNGTHRIALTFVTADGETTAGDLTAAVTVADKTVNGQIALSSIPLGGGAVTARNVYMTKAGTSSPLFYVGQIADNTTTTYTVNVADASLGAQAPSTNTTADPYLVMLRQAARERGETATRRQWITATWELRLDTFPFKGWAVSNYSWALPWVGDIFRYGIFDVPKPPLVSVTSLKYVDTGGTTQTLTENTDYLVSAPSGPRCARGRVAPVFSRIWPVTRYQVDAVQLRFQCGYGSAASAVPAQLRQAMLLDIGSMFQNRQDTVIERGTPIELPRASAAIYRSYRTYSQGQRAVA